jgi:hypothetical protein
MFKVVFDVVPVSISVGDPDPPVFGPPGSGSISRYGPANPDPHQNVMDPQHWYLPIDPALDQDPGFWLNPDLYGDKGF